MESAKLSIEKRGKKLSFTKDQTPIELGEDYDYGSFKLRVMSTQEHGGFRATFIDSDSRPLNSFDLLTDGRYDFDAHYGFNFSAR